MKKNNVFLEIVYTEFKNGVFDAHIEKAPVAFLSNEKIIKFHDMLTHTQIPANSCIYNLHINFYKKLTTNMLALEKPQDYEQESNYKLECEFCNPSKNAKCDVSYNQLVSCISNLCSGLCRDEFMINHFGKILFPQKYKHFNQKVQR